MIDDGDFVVYARGTILLWNESAANYICRPTLRATRHTRLAATGTAQIRVSQRIEHMHIYAVPRR